ncbi:MAG: peptidase modulator of gyrase [Pseudonocardiales bacterium]|nr:peptidase modulator of gyrase [Pseudonocardiales bacterium]
MDTLTVVPDIDLSFATLALSSLADAALQRAAERGASHADVRVVRLRYGQLSLRDAKPDSVSDGVDLGLSIRVIVDGTWGFAATADLSVDAAARAAEQAVDVARVSRPIRLKPVELADEPIYRDQVWVGAYDLNPFDVPEPDRLGRLTELSEKLMASDGVDHVDASVAYVQENKFYADSAGSSITQQRVRIEPEFTVTNIDRTRGAFETMRTLAPPAARGWEYLHGTGWDFEAELAELPSLLAERVKAPSVEAGRYDLVIHPSNLWLTIHESIGHATELDRALGYEAAYAGTSFATVDQLGSLRYGSEVMNVRGDRVTPNGLATIGYDDEGVAAQGFDIVKDGVLVGYQTNREMAGLAGLSTRSNGCSYADSAGHIPMQRMPNVSLQPASGGPATDELISQVERGLYIVGDKSWSIDMQRYNFQFTGQRWYRIENGKLAGQVRDAAYQATTTDFWGSMEAVGGEETYLMMGTFNCGKGQPGQVAPAGHGSPSALFRGVNVLNTNTEGGRA